MLYALLDCCPGLPPVCLRSQPSQLARSCYWHTHTVTVSSPTQCSGLRPPTQLLRGVRGDKGAAVWSLEGYRYDKAWLLLLLQMRTCGKVKPGRPHHHQCIKNHLCHSNRMKWNFSRPSRNQHDPHREPHCTASCQMGGNGYLKLTLNEYAA